jgi:uncharacterized protein (TIGR00730 family)
VLGSARLTDADSAWAPAEELGRLLAEAGAQVVTGGYGGLMAAVSRGAHSAGGSVVGLAMSGWTKLEPNEWNTEIQWSDTYPERLAALLDSEGVVALDGGVGTLSELAVVWAAAQTEIRRPRIVALGSRWARLLPTLRRELIVDDRDMTLVQLAHTPQEAIELLFAPGEPAEPARPRG